MSFYAGAISQKKFRMEREIEMWEDNGEPEKMERGEEETWGKEKR